MVYDFKDEEANFFNYAKEMLCIASFDGWFLHLNPMFHKTLGWTDEELKARPFLDFVHPEDRQGTIDALKDLGHGNHIFNFENRYLCKDGSYKWISWKSHSLPEKQQIYAVAWDINERKRMETKLKANQTKLSNIIETTPLALLVYRLDSEGDLILDDFNNTTIKMLKMDLKNHIGKKMDEIFPNLANSEISRTYKKIAKHGGVWKYEDKNIKGIYSIHAFQFSPGYITVLFDDISDKKRAEENLRKSEERFKALFQFAPVGIIITDPITDKIQDANEYFLNMMGYTIKEIQDHSTDIFFSSKKKFVQIKKELTSGIKTKITTSTTQKETIKTSGGKFPDRTTKKPIIATIEAKLIRKDGKEIPVLLNSTQRIIRKFPNELILGIQNIEEQKQAEKARLQIERTMLHSQRLESLGVLAGGIAHDFNNLLLSIMGNLDLAKLSIDNPQELNEYIENALSAVQKSTNLTRQMLAYSGKGNFILKNINLSSHVTEMIYILKASISKKIKLKMDLEQNIPKISADTGQIQQIILNLVINAAEAIGDQNGVIEINTGKKFYSTEELQQFRQGKTLKPGLFVFLRISDSGIGISPEVEHRIFEPFFTTKFTGRGLGLSTTLGIIKKHQGGIKYISQENQGTQFIVIFPLLDPVDEKLEKTKQKDTERKMLVPANQHAMVVDDEKDIRFVGTKYLQKLGFQVETASNGQDAIKLFKNNPKKYDIILLDLTMPKASGIETFRQLRIMNSELKIILSSGFEAQDAMHLVKTESNVDFLQKPYTLNKLERCLSKFYLS